MENKPTLREQIRQYIAREIALRDTPSYALSPSEMSYGIVNLIKEECGGVDGDKRTSKLIIKGNNVSILQK